MLDYNSYPSPCWCLCRGERAFAAAVENTTFGQLHNREVDFNSQNGQGPCEDALALHVSG